MDIHQLSVVYQHEHDRILVRINTTADQELRLWFTRRLCMGFMPLLTQIVADQVAKLEAVKPGAIVPVADASTKQMLSDFKRAELLEKADFVTAYKEQSRDFPLGSQPLLVTEINVTPLPTGQLQIKFNEKLSGADAPRAFLVSLEQKLVHGFLHLLDKAIEASLWKQPAADASDLLASSAKQPANDGPEILKKPRYLN